MEGIKPIGKQSDSSLNGMPTVVPALASDIEALLADYGVYPNDERVVHMLVDIAQREAYTILNQTLSLASKRQTSDAPHIGIDDAKLAVHEYMQKYVIYPSSFKFSTMDNYTEATRTESMPPPLSSFPLSVTPAIPDDAHANIMLPSWKLTLKTKSENPDE